MTEIAAIATVAPDEYANDGSKIAKCSASSTSDDQNGVVSAALEHLLQKTEDSVENDSQDPKGVSELKLASADQDDRSKETIKSGEKREIGSDAKSAGSSGKPLYEESGLDREESNKENRIGVESRKAIVVGNESHVDECSDESDQLNAEKHKEACGSNQEPKDENQSGPENQTVLDRNEVISGLNQTLSDEKATTSVDNPDVCCELGKTAVRNEQTFRRGPDINSLNQDLLNGIPVISNQVRESTSPQTALDQQNFVEDKKTSIIHQTKIEQNLKNLEPLPGKYLENTRSILAESHENQHPSDLHLKILVEHQAPVSTNFGQVPVIAAEMQKGEEQRFPGIAVENQLTSADEKPSSSSSRQTDAVAAEKPHSLEKHQILERQIKQRQLEMVEQPEQTHGSMVDIPHLGGDEEGKKRKISTFDQVSVRIIDQQSPPVYDSIAEIDYIINSGAGEFPAGKSGRGGGGGPGSDDSMCGEGSKDDDNDSDDDGDEVKAPDGGWGWVVTVSCYIINVVIIGTHNTFAILYVDLMNEFHEPAFKTAWIGSIAFGCILFFAPLSGYLSNRFGCRNLVLIGIIVSALSCFVSSYAPTLDVLYLTYGAAFGLGTSFAYTQGAVIISQYFTTRHGLASGIMLAGSSSGTLVMGKIFDALHANGLGWRPILRVFSALILSTLIFGATYRPLSTKKKVSKSPQATRIITELSLWKNKAFLIWLLCVGCCKIGYLIPWVHLVWLATEAGFTREFGSNLIQWMGVGATLSRLIIGVGIESKYRIYFSLFCMCAMGIINILQPLFMTYGGLIYYVIALGSLDGGVEILLPVMTLEIVGEEKLAVAWGCILGVVSISSIGPPIGGAIYDATGSYDGMFYFAGVPLLMATVILAIIPLWAKKQPQHPALSILSVDPSYYTQQQENELPTKTI